MTLAEKFHSWLNKEPFSKNDKPSIREYQCVVIAEEFAIEFAEWFISYYTEEAYYDKDYTKQMLEIFKKEKEL